MANLKDLQKKFKQIHKKLSKDKKFKKHLGKEVAEGIHDRIVAGYGTEGDGKRKKKFKKLHPDTIQSRRKDKKLSNKTKPNKSNQVRSGEFVDSIKSKLQGSDIVIEPSDKANKYIKYQDKDRPSFYISKDEEKIIDKEVEKMLDDIFK